jgi:hypothetical protein
METAHKRYVQSLSLVSEIDKRVALATVKIANVTIRGIAVWRSPHGKLRVYFPSFKAGYAYEDAISLPDELRSEIEADVISAYKEEKAKVPKSQGSDV